MQNQSHTTNKFAASGKLLLFGEYMVLRGSKSLAIPVKYGQTLTVSNTSSPGVVWESYEKGKMWFKVELDAKFKLINTTNEQLVRDIQNLLWLIADANPTLEIGGTYLRFDLDFERNYGWGTSSTLLSLLSQWSGVKGYYLLENSFGGSGYDIAVAKATTPVIYQASKSYAKIDKGSLIRTTEAVELNKEVASKLLFVYTGKKQSSAAEVARFDKIRTNRGHMLAMSEIVDKAVAAEQIETFESVMRESEAFLSELLGLSPVQEEVFSDYPYAVKSLGAWGGDFVMATFRDESEARQYFKSKGLEVVFNFNELIKNG